MSEHLATKLSTLHEIGLMVADERDLEQMLTGVIEAAVSITEAEEGSLSLVGESTNELYVRAQKSLDVSQVQMVRVKARDNVIGSVVRTGKAIQLSGEELDLTDGQIAHSLLCVPLTSRGHTLGALCVFNKQFKQPFTEEDEHQLSILATYSALSIAHQQSWEEIQRRDKTLSGLRKSQSSLLSVDDPQELLERIADNARAVLEADLVVLYEYLKKEEDVRIPPIIGGDVEAPEILRERGSVVPHKQSAVFQMLHRGKPFYAPNARQDWANADFFPSDWAEHQEGFLNREKIVSSAGIPLLIQGEVVGVLFINYRSYQPFTAEHRNRIDAFANQAALAIRNARIISQKERHVTELSVLNEIGQTISSAVALKIDQILELVYEQTERLMDVTNFYVAFYDEAADAVDFPLVIEDGEHQETPNEAYKSRQAGNGLTEYVIHTQKSLLLSNTVKEDPEHEGKRYRELGRQSKSWLGAPMIVEQNVLGVIGIQSYEKENAYDEGDRNVLVTIAAQVAIAIDKARLYENVQRQADELEALHKTALEIGSKEDIEHRLGAIVEAATKLLKAKGGKVYLKVPGEDKLELKASKAIDPERYSIGSTLNFGEGMAGRIMQEGLDYLIVDDYKQYRYRVKELEDLFEAVIEVPLLLNGEATGVLGVFDDKKQRTFSEAHVPILQRFARQAALAIRDARHLDEAQRRIRHLVIVNDVAQIISTKLDTDALLHEIASQIAKELGCSQCTLFFPEGEGDKVLLVPKMTEGPTSDRERLTALRFKQDESLVGLVYQTRKSQIFPHPSKHPKFSKKELPYRYHSMLLAPVIVGNEVIAVICADHDRPDGFNDSDLQLVDSLALHVAIAVERAIALKALHDVGSELMNTMGAEDVEQILKKVLYGAIKVANARTGVIFQISEDGNTLEHQYYPPGDEEFHTPPRTNKEGNLIGLTREIIDTGEIKVIEDTAFDSDFRPSLRGPIKSTIGLPLKSESLKSKSGVIGVLYLDYDHKHEFTDIELSPLKTLANQAALALANYQLVDQISKARDVARAVANEYEAILSYSPNPIIVIDSKGEVTYVNGQALRIFEYPKEKTFGERVEKFYWGGRDEAERIANLLQGDKPVRREETFVKNRQGDRIPILLSASLLEGEHGEQLGSIGIMEDQRIIALGGRVRMLFESIEAINRSEGLKDVLDAILLNADYVLEISAGCIFLREDSYLVARASYGVSLDEEEDFKLMLGEGLIGQAAQEQALRILEDLPASDRDIPLATSGKSAIIIPLKIEDDLIGVLYLESTEKDHFRAENDLIPILATQAAAAIKRSQLLEEQERNREKFFSSMQVIVTGQIATGFVHETRNYLNGIKQAIELIGKRIDRDSDIKKKKPYIDMVEAIKTEIQRSAELALRLQKRGQRHTQKKEAAYLNEIIERTLELVGSTLRKNDMRLELKMDPALNKPKSANGTKANPVHLDKQEIEQVIINLILNAIQSSRPRSPLTIETSLDKDKRHAQIKITDRGAGIKPEDLSEIFKPFFTTKSEGVGLGLYMSKIIVEENHQGKIEVESKPGRGTTFSVVLPRTL